MGKIFSTICLIVFLLSTIPALASGQDGFLDITSVPAEVSIKINGSINSNCKTTPCTIPLRAGTYSVTAEKAYYTSQTKVITVLASEITPLKFELSQGPSWKVRETEDVRVKAGVGKLTVLTQPRGATVDIDGQRVLDGQRKEKLTPFTLDDVPAGKHELIIHYGYTTIEKTIIIQPDQKAVVNESLQRSTLQINSVPSNAQVTLLGSGSRKEEAISDTTPAVINSIKPGTYRLKITKKFFESVSTTITVKDTSFEQSYNLKEMAAHSKKRQQLIHEYDATIHEMQTNSTELTKRIAQLESQKQSEITRLPDKSKKPLLSEVPGKNPKPVEDIKNYTSYNKTCDPDGTQMLCSLFPPYGICMASVYASKPEKSNSEHGIYDGGHRLGRYVKSVNEDEFQRKNRAAIEYNRMLDTELAQLNNPIRRYNEDIDNELKRRNIAIRENNRLLDNEIRNLNDEKESKYGTHLNAIFSEITNNLKEIEIAVPTYKSHEEYSEYFRSL